MRAAAAFLMLAVATGGAQASSFVTPAPMSEALSPSMILLGPPPAAAEAPVSDPLPQLAFPLGSLPPSGLAASWGDGMLPALAFALGSLDSPPAEAGPRLAFPLGSLWAGPVVQLSPSVIAIGAPAVTSETVASVQPRPKSKRPQAAPTVVRGGEVGGAFPGASGVAQASSGGAQTGGAGSSTEAAARVADRSPPGMDASAQPAPESRGVPSQSPNAPPDPRPTPLPAPPAGTPILRGPE